MCVHEGSTAMKLPSVLGLVLIACVLGAGVNGQNIHVGAFQEIVWYLQDKGVKNNFSEQFLDQVLKIYAPTSEAVENEKCREHSEMYKQAVKKRKRWALRMLDASSKVPAGLLAGNVVNLGNYDECLNVRRDNLTDTSRLFSGQHCMVNMGVNYYDVDDINVTTFNGTAHGFLSHYAFMMGAKWSVCIPSSCTPHDLESHLQSVLQDMMGDVTITVGEEACRSREQPTMFTPADWFATALLVFFAVLVALSTAYDLIHTNSAARSDVFVSFSIFTNGRKLLRVSPSSDNLQALHGIRTLSMLWVVIGHTYDHALDGPAINFGTNELMKYDSGHAVLMNYRLSVDTFLLLSGLLVCYVFLKNMERGSPFNLKRYYLHRYIRLTPAYAAMILLTATLLGYTDDGPLWEENVITAQEMCKYYWWSGLLYVNNYIYPLDSCMDQSWYLSLDMQLYLLSPLVLYPLWRWKKFGKVLMGILVLAGLLTAFLVAFIYEIPMNPDADINVFVYLPTHTRFTPYIMGVALGYLLHTTKNSTPNLSPTAVIGGWILSVGLLISTISVNHVLSVNEYNIWAESLNSALNKPAWALGVAWIVFACTKGYGGFINTFLSWNFFQVLSRLTYSVYLVHYAIVLWLNGTIKTPAYLNDKTILMQFLNVTVMSFAAALVLALVFEVPALLLEKVLLDKDVPKESKVTKYVLEEGISKDSPLGEELVEIIGCNETHNQTEDEYNQCKT